MSPPLARSLVRAAGRVVDGLPRRTGVTVLVYHRVGAGTPSLVDLPEDEFRRQVEHLAEHHRVVDLDTAVAEISAGEVRSGVVITIDDGTADTTDVALPILAAAGLPSTVYVATHFVDAGEPFPWGAPPTSWSALRDAASTGLVTLASHTHRHPEMHRMDAATAAAELDRSIDLIAEHLGAPPVHFAYPRAIAPSVCAEAEVRRRFRSAALAGSRVNRAGCDLLALGRTPIQRDDVDRFAALAAGGGRLDGLVRETVLRVRRRPARRGRSATRPS